MPSGPTPARMLTTPVRQTRMPARGVPLPVPHAPTSPSSLIIPLESAGRCQRPCRGAASLPPRLKLGCVGGATYPRRRSHRPGTESNTIMAAKASELVLCHNNHYQLAFSAAKTTSKVLFRERNDAAARDANWSRARDRPGSQPTSALCRAFALVKFAAVARAANIPGSLTRGPRHSKRDMNFH